MTYFSYSVSKYFVSGMAMPGESSSLWSEDKQYSSKVRRMSERFTFPVSEKIDCVDVTAVLTMYNVKRADMEVCKHPAAK